VPRVATVVTRFSETFEGWGFKALSIGAPVKTKKHCSYRISSRISYHTVISVLHNGPWPHGAHYAGLPRRARCGAIEAPDGLMPDGSCLAMVTASFALGWEERSILRSCRFGFTPPEPYFGPSLSIEESLIIDPCTCMSGGVAPVYPSSRIAQH
jgi:hypothetical protein